MFLWSKLFLTTAPFYRSGHRNTNMAKTVIISLWLSERGSKLGQCDSRARWLPTMLCDPCTQCVCDKKTSFWKGSMWYVYCIKFWHSNDWNKWLSSPFSKSASIIKKGNFPNFPYNDSLEVSKTNLSKLKESSQRASYLLSRLVILLAHNCTVA